MYTREVSAMVLKKQSNVCKAVSSLFFRVLKYGVYSPLGKFGVHTVHFVSQMCLSYCIFN